MVNMALETFNLVPNPRAEFVKTSGRKEANNDLLSLKRPLIGGEIQQYCYPLMLE